MQSSWPRDPRRNPAPAVYPRPMLRSTLLASLAVLGCSGPERLGDSFPAQGVAKAPGQGERALALERIPAESQRHGDPAAGYRALVTRDYIGCGIPASLYERVKRWVPGERLPDRAGPSADLPFYLTASTADSGVDIVTANCLGCHASHLLGELVIGLGETRLDFTGDPRAALFFAEPLLSGATERAEWQRLRRRVEVLAPYIRTDTVGANPADAIAAVLFAHRDPETLAWSDEALIPLERRAPIPVDVPAWWLMAKKHAMFHTGAGRGDHARIMMTASSLCTDSVEKAQEIDAYFPDIRAFIASLEPPPYPFAIDRDLAAEGERHFRRACSRCHGTYGPDSTYPNLLVPAEEVGTDPELAAGVGQFAAPFVDWFNRSFYGERSRLEPGAGYVAPPLDGVWATAPYFHNGSVPTLALVLDSSARPRAWKRRSLDSSDYDQVELGWRYDRVEGGKQAAAPSERARVYDTSLPGYSADGHTYGDALAPAARRAILEYLKTL